jgi:retinol dehydrogenase-12
MFPFQYVRDLVVFLRGLPGASGYGSTTTAEQVTEGLDLQAYTAIVTGATSGIGQEVARVLAKRGARVVLAARNAEKAQKVMSLILEETPSARLEFIHLNLASLKSVRVFAAEFLSRDLPLNILV